MKQRIARLLILLLTLVSFSPALAQLSQGYDFHWHLLSGGGGRRESTHYQIDDVLGQWVDNRTASVHYQLDPGFWYAGRDIELENLYLPVMLKTRP